MTPMIPLEEAMKRAGLKPDDGPENESLRDAIARLAKFPIIEFMERRNSEAKRFKVPPAFLEHEVRTARGVTEKDDDNDLGLFEPEPWPEAVDGADLLDRLVDAVQSHVIISRDNARAVALWAVHAHCFDCWDHTPRLNVRAPEKGCGKTTLLDVLMPLVPKALKTENINTAPVFRLMETHGPTLLVDECDTQISGKTADPDLVSILNAGHGRTGRAFRCEGDENKVKGFRVFGPAVLAGIGHLPGTLASRAIPIVLQRRRPDEFITPFRVTKARHLEDLASEIARWALDHRKELEGSEPDMPDGIFNRLADIWRPLFAIADEAGGEWPIRARETALRLMRDAGQDGDSIKVMVLSDIRDLFSRHDTDRLGSASICADLAEMNDRPWPEYRHGRPITQRQLAALLTPFEITSNTVRTGSETPRGYRLEQFKKAFAAYLLPFSSATTPQVNVSAGYSDFRSATSEKNVALEKSENPRVPAGCGAVADKKGGCPQKAVFRAIQRI